MEMEDFEKTLMRHALIGLDGYAESLEDSLNLRLNIRGSEYIFRPRPDLSPKEAVLISLLVSKCFSHPGTMDAGWVEAFLGHNSLWDHFLKRETYHSDGPESK
jgi:hypothetical protein